MSKMPAAINILIVLFTAAAIAMAYKKAEPKKLLWRFFTVLSNILCAVSSLLMAICQISGRVPSGVLLIKYIGTCAVAVTFMTVMLFLGPSMGGYKQLLSGHDFFLHLLCPLLAILSYCMLENSRQPFYQTIFGLMPVILYGIVYMYKVIYAPKKSRWEDFYGFNKNGKWPVSFLAMVIGGFVISVLIWLA